MAKNPFIVEPDEHKLELPPWEDRDGKTWHLWITVRRQLSVGEQRKMMRSVMSVTQELPKTRGADIGKTEAKYDWLDYSFARMLAYIIDWSIAHEPDFKLPPTRASYEKLPQDLFDLIDNAIDAHETSSQQEKKAPNTKNQPSAISA